MSAYWHHARPKMLPYLWLLVFGGYGWAHWDRGLTARDPRGFLIVLAAWAALHAGTLWLNAALDRDEGDVMWGQRAPIPGALAYWGYAALVVCVVLAFLADRQAGFAALGCAVLAALYSHPKTAWKGHPMAGPFVNLAGYGALSPYAGWAVADVGWDLRTGVVWIFGMSAVLGAYFAAQAFQRTEDEARGYRTFVVTHGPAAALTAARLCLAFTFVGGAVLAIVGFIPRVCVIALAGGIWVDRYFAAWARQPDGGDAVWARGLATRVLAVGVAGLFLAMGEYMREDLYGEPVAGLGTAAGWPPDRPRLSPWNMRLWEVDHPLPTD
jgi:4-hydroxybenzoate polyprenyltransferase